MNLTMHYTKRTYGAVDDEPDAIAKVVRSGPTTTVAFEFPTYALGRGTGDSVGAIRSASMTLKTEEAVALANAILELASGASKSPKELFFGSMTPEVRDHVRRIEQWRRQNPKAPVSDFLLTTQSDLNEGE